VSYLARLLAMPDPPSRSPNADGVQRAKSAERPIAPPFGTFDTCTHGRILKITPANHGSNRWRGGLAYLATMPPPFGMQPRRWSQIQADALALGETWGEAALLLGWREVDLWGCNANPAARRQDRDGLAMLLCGRSVVEITEQAASILCAGGHRLSYYRAMLDGTVQLWRVGDRE
jgi:hypothetical protein